MASTKEATKEKRGKKIEPRYPEKKWGPFAGGAGVAVWLNEFQTESGVRYARSITFAPRRFRDSKTGQWRDAGSYRPVDLPALLLAIQAAHDYCLTTPLPGEPADAEELDTLADGEGSSEPKTPF
jgi:hypothetical protein